MASVDGARDFAGTARRLAGAARARGLAAPGFRTPPRQVGCNRTIRRYPDGSALVAVAVRGRLWDDAVDDMIAGVLALNDLHGAAAAEVRLGLWHDLAPVAAGVSSAA
ncbi:MAG TPA: hypothetical protein VHT97_14185 [Acidimicrobiales bacterium]|nr:hypothetical protein [Acidimicrobiales bacterium]